MLEVTYWKIEWRLKIPDFFHALSVKCASYLERCHMWIFENPSSVTEWHISHYFSSPRPIFDYFSPKITQHYSLIMWLPIETNRTSKCEIVWLWFLFEISLRNDRMIFPTYVLSYTLLDIIQNNCHRMLYIGWVIQDGMF